MLIAIKNPKKFGCPNVETSLPSKNNPSKLTIPTFWTKNLKMPRREETTMEYRRVKNIDSCFNLFFFSKYEITIEINAREYIKSRPFFWLCDPQKLVAKFSPKKEVTVCISNSPITSWPNVVLIQPFMCLKKFSYENTAKIKVANPAKVIKYALGLSKYSWVNGKKNSGVTNNNPKINLGMNLSI